MLSRKCAAVDEAKRDGGERKGGRMREDEKVSKD